MIEAGGSDTPPVVAQDDSPELSKPAKKTPERRLPKWESEARDKLRAAVRSLGKHLSDMAERDVNEGDTRIWVTDFLCEGLGFNKYADLTTEYQVRGEFADYGLRIDKDLLAFIEVKRIATKLAAKHLRQVQSYALNEGVEWVFLTNGRVWQAYHITAKMPVEVDLALEVDLLGDDTQAQRVNQLFYLTRESLKRRQIDDLWRAKRATAPQSLADVVLSESVVTEIRKELWRRTDHRVDDSEIANLLRNTIIRPECFED